MENVKAKGQSLFLKKYGQGKVASAYIRLIENLFGFKEEETLDRILQLKKIRKSELAKSRFKKVKLEVQHG